MSSQPSPEGELEAGQATRPSQARSASGSVLAALLVVVAAQVGLLAWLVRQNQRLDWQLAQNQPVVVQRPNVERLLEDDPAVGRKLPLPSRYLLHGDRLEGADHSTMLVFASSCTGCVRPELLQWQRFQQEHPEILTVFVISDDPDTREAWRQETELSLPVALDSRNSLRQAYNAFYSPRAYLVDRQGRLVWRQRNRGGRPWEEVRRLLDTGETPA